MRDRGTVRVSHPARVATVAAALIAAAACAEQHEPPPPDVSLREADKLAGEREGAAAGRNVACAGDVDGDGAADVLVGAPNDSEGARGAGAGTNAGAAYLLRGGR